MAMNVLIPLLIPLEQDLLNTTRLLSRLPDSDVSFLEVRYCSVLFEDALPSTLVTRVHAIHKEGRPVRYTITEGNKDGRFTIDSKTGEIFLAASLDRETQSKHELVVSADVGSNPTQSLVQVMVADVNDNPAEILNPNPQYTVVEEDDRDLPLVLGKIEAKDKDWIDGFKFLYTISGDGIDGYDADDAFFTVDSRTGEIIQLRPLDRDPPHGKPVWHLKIKVHDGQTTWKDLKSYNSPVRKPAKRSTRHSKRANYRKSMSSLSHGFNTKDHTQKDDFTAVEAQDSNSKYKINTNANTTKMSAKLARYYPVQNNIKRRQYRHLLKQNLVYYNSGKGVIRSSSVDQLDKSGKRVIRRSPDDQLDKSGKIVIRSSSVDQLGKSGKEVIRSSPVDQLDKSGKGVIRSSSVDQLDKSGKRVIRSSFVDQLDKSEKSVIRRSPGDQFENKTTPLDRRGILDGGNCVRLDYLQSNLDSVYETQVKYVIANWNKVLSNGTVHTTETVATVTVKDVNDNAPSFQNQTIFGEVQENGPIDLIVAVVKAYDADDSSSGTNALLTYSIEKNVVDEETGDPLFQIDPIEGVLKTAVCCLDRETTPEYHLQVVASDGGGLKGTGNVIVRLSDLNDNSPRLSRRDWTVTVDESDVNLELEHATLFEMIVDDPDTSNYFLFRIVPGSGNGWQKFGIRTREKVGEVFALEALDFEDEKQRRGLRFLVEVTDRGPGGWDDRRHMDSAWVSISLRDVNDHAPTFRQSHFNITVPEDVAPNTVLLTLNAHDLDEGDNGFIEYRFLDSWGCFQVSSNGEVRVQKALDREGYPGVNRTLKIIAVDRGDPPKTATATVTLNLLDVNDCAPRLLPPTVFHVEENLPPKMIGTLLATDDDIWELGHGPPFRIKMSESNSEFVKKRIKLKFRPELGNGDGGAEVWTLVSLDREKSREMVVKVLLTDAAGLSTASEVVVVVDDVNDNPMRPGSKTVFLWKTMGTSTESSLGRVFVDDLDDWDTADKSFKWAGLPHPLFSLNESTGEIFASGKVRVGRYDLTLNVSDSLWGQMDVPAKVTVLVHLLTPEAISHAVPLTLSPISATELTRHWIPTKGGGKLGLLTSAVESSLLGKVKEMRVVSVYEPSFSGEGSDLVGNQSRRGLYKMVNYLKMKNDPGGAAAWPRVTCVWMFANNFDGSFVDVVKLRGLLELNLREIEETTKLTVRMGTVEELFGPEHPLAAPPLFYSLNSTLESTVPQDPSAAASLASTTLPLQVVDGNSTALVTPRLSHSKKCPSLGPHPTPPPTVGCAHIKCLNGGKCIPTERALRCICPGHTTGPLCLVNTRSFSSGSWIWLDPLPQCLPLELSFQFMSRHPEAMLLYWGSLLSISRSASDPSDDKLAYQFQMIIQISKGQPQLLLDSFEERHRIEIKAPRSLNDGEWHSIHLTIFDEGIMFMLDYCEAGLSGERVKFADCLVFSPWTNRAANEKFWGTSSPLQLGGLANQPPALQNEDPFKIVDNSLIGCLSDLRIGGELLDLGEPKYSFNSQPGCHLQDMACQSLSFGCGGKGTCRGGLTSGTYCSCSPGWSGDACEEESQTVSIGPRGFVKLALSFAPDSLHLDFGLRLRTRLNSGRIFRISSQRNISNLSLEVEDGVPCLIYSSRSDSSDSSTTVSIVGITSTSSIKALNSSNEFLIGNWNQFDLEEKSHQTNNNSHNTYTSTSASQTTSVCATGKNISTGDWFSIQGRRLGFNLVLEVKSENMLFRNETLRIFDLYKRFKKEVRKLWKKPNDEFVVDKDGVVFGSTSNPETSKISNDFDNPEICIGDFRISGRHLPLPPVENSTRWGLVTSSGKIRAGCQNVRKCQTFSCAHGLVCEENWGDATCRCPPHKRASPQGCRDFDVCSFGPCLHGGTCRITESSFHCLCPPQFDGPHCQWRVGDGKQSNFIVSSMLWGSVASALFALVIFALFAFLCHLRKSQAKRENLENDGKQGEKDNEYIAIQIRVGEKNEDKGVHRRNKKESKGCKDKKMKRRKHSHHFDEGEAGYGRLAVLLPCDDLRAYAYEGAGESSGGSLGSAISELRNEVGREVEECVSISSGIVEVLDLLKNIPDASMHLPSSKMGTLHRVGASCPERSIESRGQGYAINAHLEELPCLDDRGPLERKSASSFWYSAPTPSEDPDISSISAYSPAKNRSKKSKSKKSSKKSINGPRIPLGAEGAEGPTGPKSGASDLQNVTEIGPRPHHISLHV